MQLSTTSLARIAARHPWRTVTVWVVVLIASIAASAVLLGDALTTNDDFTNTPESKRAADLVEAGLSAADADIEFVVITANASVDDPRYAAYVERLQSSIAALGTDVVLHVGSYRTGDGPISASGQSALLPVTLASADGDLGRNAERLLDDVHANEPPDGLSVYVAGPATVENEFIHIAEQDLARGEAIGLAVAIVVLIFVFGAVVAAVVPIALAIVSIAVAIGATALIGQLFDLSFFITNIITMIGLAVGIDYSLFIVSRYREERATGLDTLDAIERSGATASKAVVFSGMTVVLALAGMLLLPNTTFRGIGLGAMLVVIVAVAASLTLLPAVMSVLGDRIDAWRVRGRSVRSQERRDRFWDRITHGVMDRPVASLSIAGGLLLLAAAPVLTMHQGFTGVSSLPDDVESKQAFVILERDFSGGLGSPVEIVVDGEITAETMSRIERLRSELAADPAFGPSDLVVAPDGMLALVSAPLTADIASDASLDVVRQLRSVVIPSAFGDARVDVLVGGATAYSLDTLDQNDRYTPIVIGFVLLLSFVLLTVAFRSLVIPAKAILLNLLSVAAAFGIVTLFFQEGTGPEIFKDLAGVLGFRQAESIQSGMPLFMFAILFGLSMDYHVFLLSRIRERFGITGDNTESVAHGLRTTGALITGAAAIMVAVFSGFAMGSLIPLQQMGFGLAVAVALDATIVRTVLVPASMELLGERNWYLPGWLAWIPEVHIEGLPDSSPVERELAEVR